MTKSFTFFNKLKLNNVKDRWKNVLKSYFEANWSIWPAVTVIIAFLKLLLNLLLSDSSNVVLYLQICKYINILWFCRQINSLNSKTRRQVWKVCYLFKKTAKITPILRAAHCTKQRRWFDFQYSNSPWSNQGTSTESLTKSNLKISICHWTHFILHVLCKIITKNKMFALTRFC